MLPYIMLMVVVSMLAPIRSKHAATPPTIAPLVTEYFGGDVAPNTTLGFLQ